MIAPTLVFTSGFDPFQLLINLATFSRAGHVAIGLGPNLLHAHERGVTLEPREHWFVGKKQKLLYEVEILPDVSPGIERCLSKIGEPYDVVGAFKLAILIALKRMWSPLRTLGPPSTNSHTCASFVMLLDPYGAHIPEWRELSRDVVTPADMLFLARGPSFRPVSQLGYEI